MDRLRSRTVLAESLDSWDSPSLWVEYIMYLNDIERKGFLFSKNGSEPLKTYRCRQLVNFVRMQRTYTHRFRVTHASYARSSKIPDQVIMERVDWQSAKMIDIYARTVSPYRIWPDSHSYCEYLGFGDWGDLQI